MLSTLDQAMSASKRSHAAAARCCSSDPTTSNPSDTHGHGVGDLLADQKLAERLKACVRKPTPWPGLAATNLFILCELDMQQRRARRTNAVIAEKSASARLREFYPT